MDIPEEAPEPSDSQSDDSTVSDEEVTQPIPNPSVVFVRSEYLEAVRVACGADSEKYVEFLRLMKDHQNKRTNVEAVQLRIKDLFKEHPELVAGFNTFLMAGYVIAGQDQNEFKRAIAFVYKVKAAYEHDHSRYKSFLDLMNRFRKSEDIDFVEVYKEVNNLFHDRQDLTREFTMKFLPD